MCKGIKINEVYRLQKIQWEYDLSKETGAGTDDSWDFFSEDTDSNIVPVRLTGEDNLTGAEPLP